MKHWKDVRNGLLPFSAEAKLSLSFETFRNVTPEEWDGVYSRNIFLGGLFETSVLFLSTTFLIASSKSQSFQFLKTNVPFISFTPTPPSFHQNELPTPVQDWDTRTRSVWASDEWSTEKLEVTVREPSEKVELSFSCTKPTLYLPLECRT